jgi:arylsulfatase A-like enzyme
VGRPVDAADRIDGVDLVPFFTDKAPGRPHETMFWRFIDQWAVRSGDWKLVLAHGGSQRPELYDLAADIGEQKDLAATHPERVAELRTLYDAWNAEQAREREKPADPGRPKRKRKAAARGA